MEIIEKKIAFEDIDMVQLLGVNDKYLHQIERNFEANLISRGNNLIVLGSDDDIIKIEKIVKELSYLLQKNKALTDEDVNTVIGIVKTMAPAGHKTIADNAIFSGRKHLISANTPRQLEYFNYVLQNDLVFAVGPAGTGKTFLAVAMALRALKDNDVQRIIITRPAVEAGESLGFLPGALEEKIQPYLRPLIDALKYMLSPEKVKSLMEKEIIEITPLAYMRGRTLSNSFIILDEAQNTTRTQMKMFLTRIGPKSKVIVTGDTTQIDLPRKNDSGLTEAVRILDGIDGIKFIRFEKKDVVRHKLVANIIRAYENNTQPEKR
jgi:phosphate starvation-inducible PhoH-like protein